MGSHHVAVRLRSAKQYKCAQKCAYTDKKQLATKVDDKCSKYLECREHLDYPVSYSGDRNDLSSGY